MKQTQFFVNIYITNKLLDKIHIDDDLTIPVFF